MIPELIFWSFYFLWIGWMLKGSVVKCERCGEQVAANIAAFMAQE